MIKNKYKAKKAVVDGIVFDSRKEAKRYTELKKLEEMGSIRDLSLQVQFELIPSFEIVIDGRIGKEDQSHTWLTLSITKMMKRS